MYLKIIGCILVAVLVRHVAQICWLFGMFRSPVYNHVPGRCRAMTEIDGGSEDIEVLPDGTAFITSGGLPEIAPKGRIFIYNVSEADSRARQLQFSENFDATDFWPHGLALWTDPDSGEVTLLVINHNPGGERIERFRYQRHPEMLVHMETITDPSMRLMNDIIAIDGDRFYFTNILYNKNQALGMLEILFMLPWGSLVYYDGARGHIVDQQFMLNGVALSPDKQYLYVALFLDGILTYRRSEVAGTERLELHEMAPLHYGVDNIHVDAETGDVWVATQSSLIDFVMHGYDRANLCGSWVMRLQATEGHLSDVRVVYANEGRETSCAASGTYHHGHLLIGTVYDSPTHCLVKVF